MDNRNDVGVLPRADAWVAWPVAWSAVWVGTLTALAVLLLIGLIGVAVGAHLVGPSSRILSWRDFGLLALVFSVGGAFFSFVAGGWVAARVAGIRRAEPAMLHGVIAWLVAVPLLVALTAVGGTRAMGSWYGDLATPAWAAAPAPKAAAAPADRATQQEAEDAARAARNGALAAFTALILGLLGSVIGGWMASGEPMHFAHYYTPRTTTAAPPPADRTLMSHT